MFKCLYCPRKNLQPCLPPLRSALFMLYQFCSPAALLHLISPEFVFIVLLGTFCSASAERSALMRFWAPLRHSLFKVCLKDTDQWTRTQTSCNKRKGKVMLPLSEVKGQMKNKNVSQYAVIVTTQNPNKATRWFDILKSESLHGAWCNFRLEITMCTQ